MLKLYLDTSALLKRYIQENGSETIDMIYDKAETGELILSFSLWNIGEALGVLDEKRRRGWLTEKEFKQTLKNLGDELLKLIMVKSIEIIPVQSRILMNAWDPLITYYVYEADALQIATCTQNKNDALISSDEKLVQISKKIGLKAFYLPNDEEELIALINHHS